MEYVESAAFDEAVQVTVKPPSCTARRTAVTAAGAVFAVTAADSAEHAVVLQAFTENE
jgi:hypothetical protein